MKMLIYSNYFAVGKANEKTTLMKLFTMKRVCMIHDK